MLTHKGTQTIKTKRLILRKFELADAEGMFNNWANNPEVCYFLKWEPHGELEVTSRVIREWINQYHYKNQYNWVIEIQSSKRVVGEIGVVTLSESNSSCEIGYCLGQDCWGQGMMTEALNGVIEYLFKEVGINRIYAIHHTDNAASGKVMHKCGMQLEGVIRQGKTDKYGEHYDFAQYAIIKADYEEKTNPKIEVFSKLVV